MNDPGDEDDGKPTHYYECPFCNRPIRSGRHAHHVPLPAKPDLPTIFEERSRIDWSRVYCEDLVICNAPDCRKRARTFQKLQAMSPDHKQKVVVLQRSQRLFDPDSFWNKPAC